MDYLWHVITIAGLYVALATSLDLITGRLGLVSLAHAALFGTGAYVVALTSKVGDWPPAMALCAAISLCGALAALVAMSSARLKEDFFVIGTFGFQMVFVSIAMNWVEVTGGPTGVSAIPQPETPIPIFRPGPWSGVMGCSLALLAVLVYRFIDKSPVARGLQAVRDNERFARSLGVQTFRLKVKTTALSGATAGFIGGMYAYYIGFIAPSQFGVGESIRILTMVILGGANSVGGPAIGATLLTIVPETLRFLGLPGSVAGNVRQILYGLVLVALVLWRPRGLIGRYEFRP